MSATNDAERAAYPALPHPQGEIEQGGGWKQPTQFFTAEQMHAYVDADRKERQLSACNFCLAEAAKARAALPIDFKQATDQGGWQPIATAPKDGSAILVRSPMDEFPFVAFWSSIAEHQGPMPGMPSGSTIQRSWLVAGAEEPNALYEPEEWMPLPAPTLLGVADGDAVGGKSGGAA